MKKIIPQTALILTTILAGGHSANAVDCAKDCNPIECRQDRQGDTMKQICEDNCKTRTPLSHFRRLQQCRVNYRASAPPPVEAAPGGEDPEATE